jgi:hypothetical protein
MAALAVTVAHVLTLADAPRAGPYRAHDLFGEWHGTTIYPGLANEHAVRPCFMISLLFFGYAD